MNLEQDLSDALHGAFGSARPSPDLRARVIAGTLREPVGSRRASRGVLTALSGLAAVALLAAFALTVVTPHATAPREPSSAASGPLRHYAVGWLSFDYPSSWKSRVNLLPWVLGLWTGSAPADCLTPTPQPSGPDSHCGRQGPLLPGTLYVTVGDYTTQPVEPPIDPTQPSALPSGGQYVTVGGQPAILVARTTETEETLDWTIAQPKEPHTRLQVHAEFAGPGAEEMRTEIVAMVASVSFTKSIKPLDLSQADAAAEGWMHAMHTFPGLDCFSTTPGEVTTGVVTEFPSDFDGATFQRNRLNKPLPVTCRMTIEPVTSVVLWKLTLTQWWTADVDRTAGSHTLVFWLDPDIADINAYTSGVGGVPDTLGDPFPYVSSDPYPYSS
jgi:hypothetical protein